MLVNDPNNEIAQGLIREIHDKLKNSNGTKQETVVNIFFSSLVALASESFGPFVTKRRNTEDQACESIGHIQKYRNTFCLTLQNFA